MRYLMILFAVLTLSQAANLARLAAAPPEVIGFWRFLGAGILLLLIAVWQNNGFKKFKSHYNTCSKESFKFAIVSGVFFFAHIWTFKFAAQNTSIANAMIIFATNPILTALGSTFFLKHKFQPKILLSYFLACIGIWLLIRKSINFDSGLKSGDISAIFTAFLYSAYLITGHEARKSVPTLNYTLIVYPIASILFFLASSIKQHNLISYPPITWISILLLIIFPTLLGHSVLSHLLKYININVISTAKLTEPVFASLMALFLFGEQLNEDIYLAFALTAISILILFEPWKLIKKNSH